MKDEVATINEQREYWLEKIRKQSTALMFASLDQDSDLHKQIMEDLGTSVLCLWRFDRKLRDARRSEENEALHN